MFIALDWILLGTELATQIRLSLAVLDKNKHVKMKSF
jgi:hypothetical protein